MDKEEMIDKIVEMLEVLPEEKVLAVFRVIEVFPEIQDINEQ